MRNIHKTFLECYGNAAVDGSIVGYWVEGVMVFETGKQNCVIFLAQAILLCVFGLEMLKRVDAVIREDQCITTSSWCSVFHSAKEVLVTSFKIFECVFEVVSLESHSGKQNSEKRHFF